MKQFLFIVVLVFFTTQTVNGYDLEFMRKKCTDALTEYGRINQTNETDINTCVKQWGETEKYYAENNITILNITER